MALSGGIGAVVLRYDGGLLHVAGHHDVSAAGLAMVQRVYPRRPARDYPPAGRFSIAASFTFPISGQPPSSLLPPRANGALAVFSLCHCCARRRQWASLA